MTYVTDALELVGLLLLILGAALWVSQVAGVPAGCGVAGVGLIGCSWLIAWTGRARRS